MERNLSFQFQYDEDEEFPDAIYVEPNPDCNSDTELILASLVCIQSLASKHGLERALEMVRKAAFGKIDDTEFDTRWYNEIS